MLASELGKDASPQSQGRVTGSHSAAPEVCAGIVSSDVSCTLNPSNESLFSSIGVQGAPTTTVPPSTPASGELSRSGALDALLHPLAKTNATSRTCFAFVMLPGWPLRKPSLAPPAGAAHDGFDVHRSDVWA